MQTYAEAIAEDLYVDLATAKTVEQLVRVGTPTLDHLTRSELRALACPMLDELAWLDENDPEIATFYRRQAGVV